MTKCSLPLRFTTKGKLLIGRTWRKLEGGIKIFQKKPQKVRGRIVSSELRLLSNIYSTDRKNTYIFGK